MFNAAELMSGDKPSREIIFDMRKCLTLNEPGSVTLSSENFEMVLNEVFEQCPMLKNHMDVFDGIHAFHPEEGIYSLVNNDPSILDGFGIIKFFYPEYSIFTVIHRYEDIMKIYDHSNDGSSVKTNYYSNDMVIFESKTSDETIFHHMCLKCSLNIEKGKVIPEGIRVTTPVCLNENRIKTSIIVKKDNPIIEVHGDSVIEAVVPIWADGVDSVTIKGDGKLTLICTDSMQPCIGVRTATGLSFGRWESHGSPPRKIIVDGVMVTCLSQVDYFAIGRYGSEFVPEIIQLNGGELICPETSGNRVVRKRATAPAGSTKIIDRMEYFVEKD